MRAFKRDTAVHRRSRSNSVADSKILPVPSIHAKPPLQIARHALLDCDACFGILSIVRSQCGINLQL